MNRGGLAVGQIGAEPEADRGQAERREPRLLAVAEQQAAEDPDVADQPEQGDGHAGELRPLRGLDGLAARVPTVAAGTRERAESDVVDDGQVSGDAEPEHRQDDHRATEADARHQTDYETDLIADWSVP